MDYNSRASQQFRSSSQKNKSSANKKEDDFFLRLPPKEIVGCISDIGVPFTTQELEKPNPPQIQMIFEWFAELLMNVTRETIEPAMRTAAEDVFGEYMDTMGGETRNMMGFYVSLKRLLMECGVTDFCFQDLLKPTQPRLVKIFSYIINFVRFRENHTDVIDQHFNEAEATKTRIDALYIQNQGMEARLAEMKRIRKATEGQHREKTKRNDEMKAQLRELQAVQGRLKEKIERLKGEKEKLAGILEDKTAATLQLNQDSSKLRPYVLSSPAALQSSLTDLAQSLSADKAAVDALDRRTRALQASTDAFGVVTSDVNTSTKLLEDVATELQKEEDEGVKAARNRDTLSERGNNVREVEMTEQMLQRQLKKWGERTDKLRQGASEKASSAKSRMDELRVVHKTLTDERSEKGREMERRRVRIEQTEKKMADLKENIENEIHSAYDEFIKMDSHIKLYIAEMDQCI